MVKHRFINFICIAVIVAAMVFTVLFSYTPLFKIEAAESGLKYADKLFDDSIVHILDIGVGENDWNALIENASSKEYLLCDITIDGESFQSAAIRTKGNTSLSNVKNLGGERYSFKVEFDHYQNGLSYYGLDKLSLNNLIFDKTYLKDFLVYDMMDFMGVDTPLASFVLVTVNGEPWGLYLAVEGVEEAFAQRNYGRDYDGELYKPDNMSMGADGEQSDNDNAVNGSDIAMPAAGRMPNGLDFTPPDGTSGATANGDAAQPDASADGGEDSGAAGGDTETRTPGADFNRGNTGGFQIGGRTGSDDVALVYTDDAFTSYSHIFGGAIFDDVTDADKRRLIESLKELNAGESLDAVVDVEEVLKYFVVHNFSLNFDSYTGSLMHNYYLYEENGQLSMIPWDYNLAFGSFNMGGAGTSGVDSATNLVNYPIDTPTSGAALEDRPMLSALLADEDYLAKYHEYFDEFISGYFESGHFEELAERIVTLIGPYVQEDATAFYTYDEFQKGAEALGEFCLLRAESIRGQLEGTIPATSDGQMADTTNLVDASGVSVSDMGAMSGMGGGGRDRNADSEQGSFTLPDASQSAEDGDGEQSTSDGQQGELTPPDAAQGADDTQGGFTQPGSAQTGGGQTSFPDAAQFDFTSRNGQENGAGSTTVWLLGGSAAILAGGVAFAILYRRRT